MTFHSHKARLYTDQIKLLKLKFKCGKHDKYMQLNVRVARDMLNNFVIYFRPGNWEWQHFVQINQE